MKFRSRSDVIIGVSTSFFGKPFTFSVEFKLIAIAGLVIDFCPVALPVKPRGLRSPVGTTQQFCQLGSQNVVFMAGLGSGVAGKSGGNIRK